MNLALSIAAQIYCIITGAMAIFYGSHYIRSHEYAEFALGIICAILCYTLLFGWRYEKDWLGWVAVALSFPLAGYRLIQQSHQDYAGPVFVIVDVVSTMSIPCCFLIAVQNIRKQPPTQ